MLLTLLFPVIAILGLAFDNHTVFLVGGGACLLLDIFGLLSGQLKFGFGAVIFYVIGYALANGDLLLGALYGATIGASIEALVTGFVRIGATGETMHVTKSDSTTGIGGTSFAETVESISIGQAIYCPKCQRRTFDGQLKCPNCGEPFWNDQAALDGYLAGLSVEESKSKTQAGGSSGRPNKKRDNN